MNPEEKLLFFIKSLRITHVFSAGILLFFSILYLLNALGDLIFDYEMVYSFSLMNLVKSYSILIIGLLVFYFIFDWFMKQNKQRELQRRKNNIQVAFIVRWILLFVLVIIPLSFLNNAHPGVKAISYAIMASVLYFTKPTLDTFRKYSKEPLNA